MEKADPRLAPALEEARKQMESGLIQGGVISTLTQEPVPFGLQDVAPREAVMTADSRFDIASVGKVFTASCCAALAAEGKLDPEHAAFIMLEVCSGLMEAEKYGIVHRDIKPENIMFDEEGTVKILDLGLSKIIGDRRLSQQNITASTIIDLSRRAKHPAGAAGSERSAIRRMIPTTYTMSTIVSAVPTSKAR